MTPGAKQCLIYRKPTNAGVRGATAGYRRDLEAIWLVGSWPTGIGGQSSLIATGARSMGNPYGLTGRYDHPHAKPVDVLESLLSAPEISGVIGPGGYVVDPFAGSGSVLVAARNLGLQAIGVEIETEYVATATRRLSQTALVF